jgi:predicted phosphodiesterase
MPYAVISDVHANLHALIAVLADIKKRKISEIFFTGDAVGYGPRPNECIDLIKANCKITLAGNHDWAAVGYTDITYFNQYAKHAVAWTTQELSDEHFNSLTNFNLIKSSKDHDALFVHATPHEPERWSYIFSVEQVEENFARFTQSLCFIGHSHLPVIFELSNSGELFIHKDLVSKNIGSRYIVNTGSVGQPRDNDHRSSYGLVYEDRIEIIRVSYNIKKTQAEMKSAGLPEMLINRLSVGM